MSVESDRGGGAGLVLGGGGARGAYASGALSVLLRELKDQVRVIVGTSAGALISAYLAANWHRSVEEAIEDGLRFWRELRFGDVFAPLMAPGGAARFARYVGEFLPVSSLHAPSILHPEPLKQTLGRLVDFEQLGENIRTQRLALGVVATPAHSNRSVVFHQGGIARHPDDPLRGIEYVATPNLGEEHILASAAIPALFPAVRVTEPEQAAGWYFDGGPRLNTPIKPALWLGADRVIVIALNSVAASRTPPPDDQPDFYVGAAHLLHAALGDPLAQDIRTLANTNALIAARVAAEDGRSGAGLAARQARQPQRGWPDEPVQPVPYIFIAPEDPSAIGEIARRVYRKHYRRPWNAGARDLWLLGKIVDGGADAMHGELLSYVFFAGEFAEELIRLGQTDAQRWIDQHPADLWQLDPLPDWTQARAATQAPSAPRS
ncbi:MAG: patatin-like phospholipase family protein [Solirubrobacteraceae bacterium]